MRQTDGGGLARGSGRLTRIGIATAIALAGVAALSPAPAGAFKRLPATDTRFVPEPCSAT